MDTGEMRVRSPSGYHLLCSIRSDTPENPGSFHAPFSPTIRWILQYARARSTPTPIFPSTIRWIFQDTRARSLLLFVLPSRGCSRAPRFVPRPSIRYPVDPDSIPSRTTTLSSINPLGKSTSGSARARSLLSTSLATAVHGTDAFTGRRVVPEAAHPRQCAAPPQPGCRICRIHWLMRGPGRLLMRRPMVFLRATHAFARILGFCRMRCSRNGNTDL
jgi:hypothetical protein